jgi:hypothetical protein
MARDAGGVLQMWEADKKVAHDPIRRCCSSVGKSGGRIGKKRFKPPRIQPAVPRAVPSRPDDQDAEACESGSVSGAGSVFFFCLFLNLFLMCCRSPSLNWSRA